MSFDTLGLSAPILKSIAAHHYEQAFPVQRLAIPAVLRGKDVLGIAQTGSGKTASFVLPLLDRLQRSGPSKNRHVKVLVLVPTRELAMQVKDVFQAFGSGLPTKVKTQAVYGGVSINPQMMQLQGTDVLVATPGRLLDLISAKAVHLTEVETLVLDEADKMLHLGFKDEMDRIFALLPARRQNILFSATLSADVQHMNQILLHKPFVVELAPENTSPVQINQTAYSIAPEKKGPFLRYLLKSGNLHQVLIFVSATRTADNLVDKLNKNGIEAAAMHSKKSQGARTEALRKFKAGALRVLVATDLASRGIDIQQLPCVINYDLPRSPKDYVHRIGRTGRAGATGEAISLITPEDAHHFKIIQKKTGKQVPLATTDDIDLKGF